MTETPKHGTRGYSSYPSSSLLKIILCSCTVSCTGNLILQYLMLPLQPFTACLLMPLKHNRDDLESLLLSINTAALALLSRNNSNSLMG
jgi:hypothetical protein